MTNRSNSGQYVSKLSRIISYSAIPLLAEEWWRDSLIEAGAPGAKREPDRAKPQLVVSSAKHLTDLTTPSAPPARWLPAQPPLLCEEGNTPLMEYELPERRLCLICTVPRRCSIPATIGV